jgi:hypothetical protein
MLDFNAIVSILLAFLNHQTIAGEDKHPHLSKATAIASD